MSAEEGRRIYSNDYVDLLFFYNFSTPILKKYTDATVQFINPLISIAHVPVQQITDKTISQLGYSAIPPLYGIVSQLSLEASGITKIRNIPNLNFRGKGVLVGIFDTGIDYTNPIFKNADNTTKSIMPITVTAYNATDKSLYQNASKGYTRIGVIKPEIAAPGVNIISPTLDQNFAPVTGTSPAAAHTAGVAAMILEWAMVKGNLPLINTTDIKILMTRSASRKPGLQYPNPDWGYGILDVYNIFNRLRSGS